MSNRPTPRVVIQGVQPEIDCGRFPIKRTIGETVDVEADVFADGYDVVACVLRYRHEDDETWSEIAMEPLGNDHWRAQFAVGKLGQYIYTIAGWPDPFQTWYQDFLKRISAGQDVTVDLVIGAGLLQAAAQRAAGTDAAKLKHLASDLKPADVDDRLSALASS
ncbi:MAG: alpha-1,4-glucan--maltose-1-phosphate maltosyltransferase, partial [Acidobacteria bacterium]